MTSPAPRLGETLDDVLADAERDSIEFPYLLANHVPMVLVALERMGASPARLREWYEIYRSGHAVPPMPPAVAPIVRSDWMAAMGDRTREADYRAFFIAEVKRLGIDTAIRTYLPPMIQGVAGSATHPLMRLAYGVLRTDPTEVGNALGYWATTHLPLPGPTGAAPVTDDPADPLVTVASLPGIRDYQTETDLLWHNIRAVAALPGFAPIIDRLDFTPASPRKLAATALVVFAATMDFSALHGVTGLHWIRLVSPHLDAPLPLYRAFWQVVTSLVPKIGFPELPSAETVEAWRATPAPAWPEIHRAAVASNDEHDVSLTFSAWQEEMVWGDPLYRVVAARRVGLLP